jgi:SAM-dependent methyltransferase
MRRPAFIARQASHPSGLIGRLLLRVMARETARFNREILDRLEPRAGDDILEVGYGHGRALATAGERVPAARLSGIDISGVAQQTAAQRCRALVAAGRLDLRVGDSSHLPWDAAAFDRVFSVNTLYFWYEPVRDLGEIRRVLRPSGRLVVGFRDSSDAAVASFPSPIYRFRSAAEVSGLLARAGFETVEVHPATTGSGLWIAVAGARAGETHKGD